jgi:arylsulfatase A-like enzyme
VCPLLSGMAPTLIATDYSAVTHSDWLLGMVLDQLDQSGVADRTLVLVTGDHGWQVSHT